MTFALLGSLGMGAIIMRHLARTLDTTDEKTCLSLCPDIASKLILPAGTLLLLIIWRAPLIIFARLRDKPTPPIETKLAANFISARLPFQFKTSANLYKLDGCLCWACQKQSKKEERNGNDSN